MDRGLGDLDALMREEKRLTVLESQAEAWAEGRSAGIEPELIAEVVLATALVELMRGCGTDSALSLLDRMRERVIAGEFEDVGVRH